MVFVAPALRQEDYFISRLRTILQFNPRGVIVCQQSWKPDVELVPLARKGCRCRAVHTVQKGCRWRGRGVIGAEGVSLARKGV